jgi:23S rRNA (cytidine1920-2'-O)/16S rRNA (cytidine1409-2'-O)-methyltransferase
VKLAAALDRWDIRCGAGPWIDAGCSTGGFTDCLLQRGAPLVYAVDVGEGQLDWRLRNDGRVRVMEGTNIMDVAAASLDPAPAFATADLSFRSLRRAARHILGLTTGGRGIFLVKPQFEYDDAPPDFQGVVHTQAIAEIVEKLWRDLAAEGVFLQRAMPSPIPGRKGNRELLWLLELGVGAGRPMPPEALVLQ